MPKYKNSLVIVFGGLGCLKTTTSELYVSLSCNTVTVNRDCVAIGFSSGQSAADSTNVLRRLIFRKRQSTAPKDKKLVYESIIAIAKSNLANGKTVLLEGNFAQWFGDDIMREFLFPTEKEYKARTYDVCLLHITCSDPTIQFARILKRNASRDASILNRDIFFREDTERKKVEEAAIRSLPSSVRLLRIDTKDFTSPEHVAGILPQIYEFVTANMLPDKAKMQELRAPTPNLDLTKSPFDDARTDQIGSEDSGDFAPSSSRPSSDVTPEGSPAQKPAPAMSTPSSGPTSLASTPERIFGMPALSLGERAPTPMLSAFQSTRDPSKSSVATVSSSSSSSATSASIQEHSAHAASFSPAGS